MDNVQIPLKRQETEITARCPYCKLPFYVESFIDERSKDGKSQVETSHTVEGVAASELTQRAAEHMCDAKKAALNII